MRTLFFTLVLDGFPFLPRIYENLRQLDFEWDWWVMEGVAAPVGCTKWVAPTTPRLSEDGTNGYLRSLAAFDPRVHHVARELWHGKVAMCNAPLLTLYEPALLIEIDSDEHWSAEQLTRLRAMFLKSPKKNCAYFRCRYFVGPDVVINSRNGYGNNEAYEWHRAWRIGPGSRWETHEPPKLRDFASNPFSHDETEKLGLVFDHFAYATEAQVRFKERYYGSTDNEAGKLYAGAVEGWRRLQRNDKWPVELKTFLPWVGKGVTAERLKP